MYSPTYSLPPSGTPLPPRRPFSPPQPPPRPFAPPTGRDGAPLRQGSPSVLSPYRSGASNPGLLQRSAALKPPGQTLRAAVQTVLQDSRLRSFLRRNDGAMGGAGRLGDAAQRGGLLSDEQRQMMRSSAQRGPVNDGGDFDLHPRQVRALNAIFTLLDEDGDGLLDTPQLERAIKACGVPAHPRLLKEIKAHVPSWIRKGTDFQTFFTVMVSRLRSNPVELSEIDDLMSHFALRGSRNGVVPGKDLRRVLQLRTKERSGLRRDQVDAIFADLGIMDSSEVSVKEFIDEVSSGYVILRTVPFHARILLTI